MDIEFDMRNGAAVRRHCDALLSRRAAPGQTFQSPFAQFVGLSDALIC